MNEIRGFGYSDETLAHLQSSINLVDTKDPLNKGCFLLGLFRLFLFRFRNNRIHGISISKRTLIHSENGILMAAVT